MKLKNTNIYYTKLGMCLMETDGIASEIARRVLPEDESEICLSRLGANTKNNVYSIEIGGEKKYVLKLQKKHCPEREKRAADFFTERGVCKTLVPFTHGDIYTITFYDGDIIHESPDNSAARLAIIHQKLLEIESDDHPKGEDLFRTKPRDVIWRRVENYGHLLDPWVPSREVISLRDIWRRAPSSAPEILLHGDPHPGNIVRDSSGVTKALDFEFAMIGNVTEDLAKTIISQNPSYMRDIVSSYLDNSPALPGFSDEREFVSSVLHDIILEGSYMVIRSEKKHPGEEKTWKRGERFTRLYEELTSSNL